MPNLKTEATEAVCSALYRMPFAEFLGEGDVGAHHLHWFHLGERPKDIRVTVGLPLDKDDYFVTVKVEWRNHFVDPRNPLHGEQTLRINTRDATQADLGGPTTNAVLRVLEILNDVRGEIGVAGKISDLAPKVPEVEEDPSDL